MSLLDRQVSECLSFENEAVNPEEQHDIYVLSRSARCGRGDVEDSDV